MLENNLITKLEAGKIVFGLGNMYPAPGIIVGMCPGWDFVWVDGQHGQYSYDSILHSCLAAASVGVDVLLRVPSGDCSTMGNYLDLATSAVMIPMVNTAEQGRDIVELTKFPPLGSRSFGGRRIVDLEGRDYYKNNRTLIVAQVETEESVENIDEIIDIDGIDLLFFGPDDMKVQMGLPIDTPVLKNEKLYSAMEKTARAAEKAKKYCGCIVGNPEDFAVVKDMGYRLIVTGGDSKFLKNESKRLLKEYKG